MRTTYLEYINENTYRRYPFVDAPVSSFSDVPLSSIHDVDGRVVPDDFILDAHLHCIDGPDSVYLREIKENFMFWADVATGEVVAANTIGEAHTSKECIEVSGYDRSIGIVVFGDGVNSVSGNYRFTPDMTTLVGRAYNPLRQQGVRGILLPDGELVRGDVVFEGRDGVVVTTRTENGTRILRFDVLGVPYDILLCDEDAVPICNVDIVKEEGSPFSVEVIDSGILVSLDMTIDEFKVGKKNRARFDNLRDPCLPPEEPEGPPPPSPAQNLNIDLCKDFNSGFNLIVADTGEHPSILRITTDEVVVVSGGLTKTTTIDNMIRTAGKAAQIDTGAEVTLDVQCIGP